MLVRQVDGQPVDLRLAQVAHRTAGVALDPFGPAGQVVDVEHVVQAQHPLGVLDGGEQGGERPGDPLGGRLRGTQRRVLVLQPGQLAHERVVLAVGDRRRVEDVVPVCVVVDLRADRGVPLPGDRGRLGPGLGDLGRGDLLGRRYVLGRGPLIGDVHTRNLASRSDSVDLMHRGSAVPLRGRS